MSTTYVNPEGESSTPIEPYTLRLDLARRPLRLGLLENTFPDAKNFMDCVERELRGLLPEAKLLRFKKPNTDPVPPKVLADMLAQCDGMISAWGH